MKITIDGIRFHVEIGLCHVWLSPENDKDIDSTVMVSFFMDKVVDGELVGVWGVWDSQGVVLEGTLLDVVNKVIPILKGKNMLVHEENTSWQV